MFLVHFYTILRFIWFLPIINLDLFDTCATETSLEYAVRVLLPLIFHASEAECYPIRGITLLQSVNIFMILQKKICRCFQPQPRVEIISTGPCPLSQPRTEKALKVRSIFCAHFLFGVIRASRRFFDSGLELKATTSICLLCSHRFYTKPLLRSALFCNHLQKPKFK